MINRKLHAMLIEEKESIRNSLCRLCDSGKGIVFLVSDGMLKGALSDGDVRRYLLAGGGIDDQASNAANHDVIFLFSTERERAESVMVGKAINAVPIVDDLMRVVDVEFLNEKVPIDDVSFRKLNSSDLGMVLEFFDQMAGDTRAMFNRGDVNRIRVIKHLNSGGRDGEIHFAATVKSKDGAEIMVGYVFLWDIDMQMPWLGIAVREDWKGHQLGRRMLKWIDDWAEPKGYGGIMLTSVPANIRAHSLYVRMGYQYFGTHPNSEFLYIKRYIRKDT